MDPLKSFVETLPDKIPQVQVARFFTEIDSTNLQAKRMAEDPEMGTALLVAEGQRAGRGRRGRSWESPSGKGLYFSILIHPKINAKDGPLLTLAAGLALGRTLREAGASDLVVKWPNDILIQGKKVAGLLGEMKSFRGEAEHVVMGVGVNVSQKPEDFSKEVAALAGSLEGLTEKKWSREKILTDFLPAFFQEIKNLEMGRSQDLLNRWEKESGLIGKNIEALRGQEKITGTVKGLTAEGHLSLLLPNGKVQNLMDEDTTLL